MPLAIDLCCGLGGWAEGLIAAGWFVRGFDVDPRFSASYPGEFICADVRRPMGDSSEGDCLPRSLFAGAELVVASPPCQGFSRHDQPWTRMRNPPPPDTSIWEACVQVARAIEAPLILENVRGAQKFMGRASWHGGPYHLWGDVPALMPQLRGLRAKESFTSAAVAERSKIPFELSLHIGRVFLP